MKIKILPNETYLAESKDKPIEGRSYNLEDATNGTSAQNKTFHALLSCYYASGMCSYQVESMADFKKQIKRQLGAGFDCYYYAGWDKDFEKPQIYKFTNKEDIPKGINKNQVFGHLKSWANYTKPERTSTIDNLIAEMRQAGVNSKKFDEIMEGLEQ